MYNSPSHLLYAALLMRLTGMPKKFAHTYRRERPVCRPKETGKSFLSRNLRLTDRQERSHALLNGARSPKESGDERRETLGD